MAKIESTDESAEASEADRRAAKEVESILGGNPVDFPGLDEFVGTHESEYYAFNHDRIVLRCWNELKGSPQVW